MELPVTGGRKLDRRSAGAGAAVVAPAWPGRAYVGPGAGITVLGTLLLRRRKRLGQAHPQPQSDLAPRG